MQTGRVRSSTYTRTDTTRSRGILDSPTSRIHNAQVNCVLLEQTSTA